MLAINSTDSYNVLFSSTEIESELTEKTFGTREDFFYKYIFTTTRLIVIKSKMEPGETEEEDDISSLLKIRWR
jgi:hypothetical protein